MKRNFTKSLFQNAEKIGLKPLILIFITVISLSNIMGQTGKFKAAYIYNFTRFIEWPASFNTNQFVIGVYGKDAELIAELENLVATKKVENKPIKTVILSSIDEAIGCNIVFVTARESDKLPQFSVYGKNNSVLLISESSNGIKKGAAMNFVMNGNRLAFEIKGSNTNTKNLKISSSLESLALNKY